MNSTTAHFRDQPSGYGSVSRAFHWLMALLFAWQFFGAALHAINRDLAISAFFWGTHRNIGALLFVLVFLRGAWGLANMSRRPRHEGLVGQMASLGHLALYALMVFCPSVALLRQYGSARPFEPFGLPLMAGGGERIEWMTALGSATHSLSAWVLLTLVAGHIAMVFVHHFAWKDDTARMMVRGVR
ncbi:cytochrome b [Rhizobiaceae bacterium BDR2-2]|uniref:Cytochrome b n=1 Tax=Ectorhizobium quercum TaxID=2965071 RepID=A0AAE3SY61_9HYPH|nr:cytochrome b [Ectorhizobium quercum]MCX8999834.1 cytochrome b [Ectorhizobium quercum]